MGSDWAGLATGHLGGGGDDNEFGNTTHPVKSDKGNEDKGFSS